MSRLLLIPALALLAAGCGSDAHSDQSAHDQGPAAATPAVDDHSGHAHSGHDHSGHSHGGEGIAVTATVRENLGITFVKAEYRVVQGLLRLPGRYEAEPSARRAYQMPLSGRVEVLVKPFQRVAIGDPLYRVASAGWNTLQRELSEAVVAAQVAGERYTAAQAHSLAVEQAATLWRERAAKLERLTKEVGGKAAELAEASGRAADLLIQQAESRTRLAELKSAAQGADGSPMGGLAAIRLRHLLSNAACITSLDPAALTAERDGRPLWLTLEDPVIVAHAAGVIEGEVATTGTWLEERATVLTVTDPTGVRVRANALQSDLPKLRDGLTARIVASDPLDQVRVEASVVLAPVANPVDRSLDVIARPVVGATLPAGVRPGVTALLEVVVSGSTDEELAIPLAATIRDGLKTIFYKRNRMTPDLVEKVEADLGVNDGRWVVVNSGVKEGDELVLGGIYPLTLSQQVGGGAPAGHFEADGTFHTVTH